MGEIDPPFDVVILPADSPVESNSGEVDKQLPGNIYCSVETEDRKKEVPSSQQELGVVLPLRGVGLVRRRG